MLRWALWLLLVSNAGYFAWTQGYLGALGLAPQEQREPERLQGQVQPDMLRLLNGPRAVSPLNPAAAAVPSPEAATSNAGAPATPSEPVAAPANETAPPASPSTPPPVPAPAPVAQAPETTACWQAGGFTEAQTEALRGSLGQLDLPRNGWRFNEARSGGRWIVYMGRYDNQEQVERKKTELRELKVAFRELSAAGLGPGLALGTYSSEAAAEKALAAIVRTGVRTARVAQERAESVSYTLRLPRITPTQRDAVAGLGALLAGKPLKRCN